MGKFFAAIVIFFSSMTGYASHLRVNLGPEIYHIERIREGGTWQTGYLAGVRLGFDRIRRHKIYFGADFLYANGTITGETATGRNLKSDLKDEILELRLGYTLQQKDCRKSFIVPYVGYGYFRETNCFYDPSPLPCTFTDSFHFVSGGFLSGVYIKPFLQLGLNFKMRFMQEGKSCVSDDPVYDDVTLEMEDEIHARVEVPITFQPRCYNIGFQFTPFYEYRHFGGREGFPFNFKDTKFYLYGGRLALTYQF